MRVLFLLFFSFAVLQADIYTQRLYDALFSAIYPETPVFVFADKDAQDILNKSDKFEFVKDCTQSDVIIGSDFPDLSQKCFTKPLFATSYRAYKKYKNSFGAFYWRKGRPQIHFKPLNLKRFSIALPENLKKYIDE